MKSPYSAIDGLKKSGMASLIKVNGEDFYSMQITSNTKYPVHQAIRLSDPSPMPIYIVVADIDDEE